MTHSVDEPRQRVMRRRLIFGGGLALGIIALMLLDGLIAFWLGPRLSVQGLQLGPWLTHGLLSTILLSALGLLLAGELVQLAALHGDRPLRFETFLFALGLVIGPYVSYNAREVANVYDEAYGMLWLSIALGYTFWAQAARRGADNALRNIAVTMFIVFYAGGLVGYMTKLRMEIGGYEGAVLLLFSMFVVKMTDTGAYFVGSFLGRTKFIPWLSPKKTWEGIIGGVIVAVLSAIAVGLSLQAAGLCPRQAGVLSSPFALALFGLLMALLAIAGDLAGSLLKRDAAVKDSSRMIPGLGGMLDILDSPLLAAPAAWLFWTRLATLAGG